MEEHIKIIESTVKTLLEARAASLEKGAAVPNLDVAIGALATALNNLQTHAELAKKPSSPAKGK